MKAAKIDFSLATDDLIPLLLCALTRIPLEYLIPPEYLCSILSPHPHQCTLCRIFPSASTRLAPAAPMFLTGRHLWDTRFNSRSSLPCSEARGAIACDVCELQACDHLLGAKLPLHKRVLL